MFEQRSELVHGVEIVEFYHTSQAVSLKVIPSAGGLITSWKTNTKGIEHDLIDGVSIPDLPANPFYKGCWLAPFPNRLDHGSFTFEGRDYQLPVNEPDRQNSLHGLIHNQPMQLDTLLLDEESFKFALTLNYPGDDTTFPFAFTHKVTLSGGLYGRLSITWHVTNNSNRIMPFGTGWHPYFQLSIPIDNIKLTLPLCEKVLVDQRMIPTGERDSFGDFQYGKLINNTLFDSCFHVDRGKETFELKLMMENESGLTITQETGPDKFNYLQIYTPPGRRTIAIEPMTCNIDSFNNLEGLIEIPAGGTWSSSVEINSFSAD